MRQFTYSFAVLILLVASAGAIGSKEKSPEEQAAESAKKATEKYNNGVKHMDKAKEKAAKGDSTYAYNYRATSDAKSRKEFEKAIKDFNEAIELKPDFKEAHNNLGYCYRKIGLLDQSLSAYGVAIKLDSTFAQAREYRGETYLALGLLPKALEEHAALKQMESHYADTLAAAIELYRLQQLDAKMKEANGDS
jgi:tetratricopeptide (TPR) repeat protein